MMNRTLAALRCCILFLALSCTKSDSTDSRGSLQAFTVTVVERTSVSAVIQWDSCINTGSSEVPKYRVMLTDRVVHSNLSVLADSLTALNKDTVYTGKVVAYISTGDTVFSNFTIPTYQGAIYAATYSSTYNMGRLGCFTAYPDPGIYPQPSIWRINIPYNTTSYVSVPTVSNDTLFTIVGTRLTAIRTVNGSTIWQAIAGINFISPATYNNGRLYACTNLGLVAINSSTGQVIWTYSSPTPQATFDTEPVVDGGKVFVGNTSYSLGQLHAVDALSGIKQWSVTNGTICERPLAVNGVVVTVTGGNASATAYNSSTGSVLWTKTGLGANSGLAELNPVFSEGNVLVQFYGPLYALNLQTGAKAWELNGPNVIEECVAGNGMVYFTLGQNASPDNTVYGVNGKTGQVVWNSPLPAQGSYSDLVFAKDRLYCLLTFSVIQSNSLQTFNGLTGKMDLIFQNNNPVSLNFRESIRSFTIKRDGVVYYPAFHGNYH